MGNGCIEWVASPQSSLVLHMSSSLCSIFPGSRPSGAEAWLEYIAGNLTAWWAILGLSVLTDFLLVPVALSLYLALKGIDKNAMLVATAFVGLFVVLDLALTWTNYASGSPSAATTRQATDAAQRAVFVAAAIYPSSVVESNLLFVYNSFTLGVGILITGSRYVEGNLQQEHGLLGLAYRHPCNCFGSKFLFRKFREYRSCCPRFRSHYSVVLVCRLQTLQARSAVIPGERTVHTYAQWLANHERPHIKQIERIVNPLRMYHRPPLEQAAHTALTCRGRVT